MRMGNNLLILLVKLCVVHSLRLCGVALIAYDQSVVAILVMLLSFISTSYDWFVFGLIFIGTLQQLETIADLWPVKAVWLLIVHSVLLWSSRTLVTRVVASRRGIEKSLLILIWLNASGLPSMCLRNVSRSLFRIATHGVLTLTKCGSVITVRMWVRGGLLVCFWEEWWPCTLAYLPSMFQSRYLVMSHFLVSWRNESGWCELTSTIINESCWGRSSRIEMITRMLIANTRLFLVHNGSNALGRHLPWCLLMARFFA